MCEGIWSLFNFLFGEGVCWILEVVWRLGMKNFVLFMVDDLTLASKWVLRLTSDNLS